MKRCSKCRRNRRLSSFSKRYGKPRSQCKYCESAAYKTWLANNSATRRAINDRYEARNPERHARYRAENPEQCKASTAKWRAKNHARFYRVNQKWHAENPECKRKSAAAYRATRREEARARTKQWRKDNPERENANGRIKRARKAAAEGTHTFEEWSALVDKFKGHCVCCREYFGLKKLTEDHVIPLTKGGSDWIENIQPLCSSCNSKKKNSHSTDYRVGYVFEP